MEVLLSASSNQLVMLSRCSNMRRLDTRAPVSQPPIKNKLKFYFIVSLWKTKHALTRLGPFYLGPLCFEAGAHLHNSWKNRMIQKASRECFRKLPQVNTTISRDKGERAYPPHCGLSGISFASLDVIVIVLGAWHSFVACDVQY